MPGPMSHLPDWPRGQRLSRCQGCGGPLASRLSGDGGGCQLICGADDPCGWAGPWGERTWEGRRVGPPVDVEFRRRGR